jgi:hypothetical protein
VVRIPATKSKSESMGRERMTWGFHFWGPRRGLECAEGGPRPAIGALLEVRGERTGGREEEQRCLEMAEGDVGKLARGSP